MRIDNANKSKTEKSALNMTVLGINRFIITIIRFISRTVFIKYLSVEYLGINGLFSNILIILSFAELGIGNVIVYNLYKPIKEGNENKIHSLLLLYKRAYNIIALIVIVIGILTMPLLKYIIKDAPNINESIYLIYLLYILHTSLSYLFVYKRSILIADQNEYIISLWSNIFFILQQILQTLVLILFRDLIMYLMIQMICTLINNIFISRIADKKYPYIKSQKADKLPEMEKSTIFKDVKALAISKVSGVVMNGTDNIIISSLFGLTPVGIVSNYTLIINSVNGIIWSAISGIKASVGILNTDDDKIHKKNIFDQMFLSVYWIYSVICICLLVLLNPFIELWIGKEYLIDSITIFGLVFIIYVSGVNFTAYTFRTTKGIFNEVKYIYVLSAVINIALSIVLGKSIGLAGIFFATSISKIITIEVADGFYTYRRVLGISPKLYFSKYVYHLILFIINYSLVFNIVGLVYINGLIGFIVKGTLCILLSNLFNTVFFFKTKTFCNLKERGIKIVNKKSI